MGTLTESTIQTGFAVPRMPYAVPPSSSGWSQVPKSLGSGKRGRVTEGQLREQLLRWQYRYMAGSRQGRVTVEQRSDHLRSELS